MDIMSLISNAMVTDCDGDELGTVMGVHIVGGKMTLSVDVGNLYGDEDDGDDPDGGEEIEEDEGEKVEEDAPKVPLKAPYLKAVGE